MLIISITGSFFMNIRWVAIKESVRSVIELDNLDSRPILNLQTQKAQGNIRQALRLLLQGGTHALLPNGAEEHRPQRR